MQQRQEGDAREGLQRVPWIVQPGANRWRSGQIGTDVRSQTRDGSNAAGQVRSGQRATGYSAPEAAATLAETAPTVVETSSARPSQRDMSQDTQHVNQEETTTPRSRRREHAPVLITDAESPPQTVLARADPAPPEGRLPSCAPMRVLGLQALRDAPWKEMVLPLPTVRHLPLALQGPFREVQAQVFSYAAQ